MRQLIIDSLTALQADREQKKLFPPHPNELDLGKEISRLLKTELDAMIDEGSVKVTGVGGVNQHRMLTIK